MVAIVVGLGVLGVGVTWITNLPQNSEKLGEYWQKLTTFFQGYPDKQATELWAKLLKQLWQEVDRPLLQIMARSFKVDISESVEYLEKSLHKARTVSQKEKLQMLWWLKSG
jgi:hypothetical protein